MPPKRLNGQEKGYIGDSIKKYKPPPKKYEQSDSMEAINRENRICLLIKYPDDEEIRSFVTSMYTPEQIQQVRDKYFKDYQTTLL